MQCEIEDFNHKMFNILFMVVALLDIVFITVIKHHNQSNLNEKEYAIYESITEVSKLWNSGQEP